MHLPNDRTAHTTALDKPASGELIKDWDSLRSSATVHCASVLPTELDQASKNLKLSMRIKTV